MQIISNSIKGIYRDFLKGEDGAIMHDSGWVSNAIVDRCRILLAGFMKNEISNGIQYLAVGQGLEQWDTTGAPAPNPATTIDLENQFTPTIPVTELDLAFLDENEAEVAGPTNRIANYRHPGAKLSGANPARKHISVAGIWTVWSIRWYRLYDRRHPSSGYSQRCLFDLD